MSEESKYEYKIHPFDLSCIHDRKPKISVIFKDEFQNFGGVALRLYLDDEMVKCEKLEKRNIVYFPEKNLEYGEHRVKLVIKNCKKKNFHIKWTFYVDDKDKEYNFYYGNPHSHTGYSDGKETPTEAFEYARDKELDFLMISDHVGKLLKNNTSYDNSISLHGCKYPKWAMTKLEADRINSKYDDFVAIVGFELSTVFWGHMNFFDCNELVNKKKFMIEDMSQWINTHQDLLLVVNHPFKTVGTLKCESPFNKCILLYEYGNGSPPRPYIRSEDLYYKVLDDGWTFGAINGQDNHQATWGDADNLTGVIAENLTKKDIVEAMRMRRVFSTESRTLRLLFKLDEYFMGSIINVRVGESLNVEVHIEDLVVNIEKVQLISNGGVVINEHIIESTGVFEWNTNITVTEDNTWYLVKAIMNDDKIGISSPIFLRK
ncbi:hypothetical protein SH2C18_36840 [Clostridium sediminicola]|uniref:CehA/McbA family metallohydrolase n=1 Tax=Clostridium sediminicola TaxID=3114879 RepID=UPI0031F21DAA